MNVSNTALPKLFKLSAATLFLLVGYALFAQPILDDHFERDETSYVDEWTRISPTHDVYLNGSSLIFENFEADYSAIRVRELEFDTAANYEIKALVELNKGGNGNAYGLVWGYIDEHNYNTFEISNYGEYRICRVDQGNRKILAHWTDFEGIAHEQIGDDDFFLEIKRKDGYVTFSLGANDIGEKVKEVTKLQDDFHAGSGIGFTVTGKQQIKASYLTANYL